MDIPQHLFTDDIIVVFGRSRYHRRDDLNIIQLHLPKRYIVTVINSRDFEVRISVIRNDFYAVIDNDIRDFTATIDRISIEQSILFNINLFIEVPPVVEL